MHYAALGSPSRLDTGDTEDVLARVRSQIRKTKSDISEAEFVNLVRETVRAAPASYLGESE